MRIEIGNGTVVETATQEDVDYVEANFREGERREHEACGGGRTTLDMFEDCWTVRHRGDVIGYCGIAVPAGMSVFAPCRWLCYMSCGNAEKYRYMYVRQSREVMRRIVAETPGYVEEFRSLPAARYAQSVKWHERVLKMRRLGTARLNGEDFALFAATRREVLG